MGKKLLIGAVRYDKRDGIRGEVVSVSNTGATLWVNRRRKFVPYESLGYGKQVYPDPDGINTAINDQLELRTYENRPRRLPRGWKWLHR